MLGINMVGVCEAFAMGVKAGVDASALAKSCRPAQVAAP